MLNFHCFHHSPKYSNLASLPWGDEARAHMARVLAIETSSVLILDEFTSMVDRPTAKRMAKGLQKLVKQGTHGSITAAVKQYCVHIIKERERDNQSPPLPENYAC